ncbi:16S rRNA (cytidine(1402)-2'-O)-methyltransferase [Paradesulfitobacterium ferrireducens]|uniref:16S rRNA (cytidine(1402)-2'-O)-methyltransferase n=1 Tax=Paradesulfitobacterium ferrireducens TaxID=2816476 RepID=UPI001A8F7421|nr:16S rRNA (cytidine(1402)-2'-O)-methyltransferase [Paradesulfitobacterium ferrireducens]
MLEKGTLYVCATPIGNLKDITLRVLETLREADVIAAEDTRHSGMLLKHYGIDTPLTSYHEHNEKGKARELVDRLKEGQSVALISDAGMPGISDPGYEVIRLCREQGVKVDVLPGPNAALTALVLSGMPASNFLFYGFLPAQAGPRRRALEDLAELSFTLIFYEAPHRLLAALTEMEKIMGTREARVVRELTKLHQSVHAGTLPELIAEFEQNPPRGECCIILAPYVAAAPTGGPEIWRREVEEAVAAGFTRQEGMKSVAKRYGVSKREVYRSLIEKLE